MHVICQVLSLGVIPTLHFDKPAFKWVVERSYEKCKCCGQYLPNAFLAPTKITTKWQKVQGNTVLSVDEVRKSELRTYLTKIAKRLPRKYGNKGTLVVLFQPQDAKDHTQESLDNSEDWVVHVAYAPGIHSREDYDQIKGAPKRIKRIVK